MAAVPISTILEPLWSTINSADWVNLRPYRLSSLRFLCQLEPQTTLLSVAIRFWDSGDHVFRFGVQELCPTVEEFKAYLGGFVAREAVIPPFRINLRSSLACMIGMSLNEAGYAISADSLNIPFIMSHIMAKGPAYDEGAMIQRSLGICLCLLASFVLTDEVVSPALIGVVQQIHEGKDVIPMVLAETIMGLDAAHTDGSLPLRGCPLLLQMWLCDKLHLLEARFVGETYSPSWFIQRRPMMSCSSAGEWQDFFEGLSSLRIIWRCRWLDLPAMSACFLRRWVVVIAGLDGFTFYMPCRIMRQFGRLQVIPPEGSLDPVQLPAFSRPNLLHYQADWWTRTTWAAEANFHSNLSREYRQWMEDNYIALYDHRDSD